VFLLAQYLQIVDGYTPLEAGIRTLPWTAAPMIIAPIAGLLAPRVGVRVLLGTGLTLQALGLAWLALAAGASTPYLDLVPGFILAGIGMGLTFAPSATAVLADMAPDDHATASSTNSTIREIGVALGVAVLVAVFRANGGTLTPDGYSAGLRAAMQRTLADAGVPPAAVDYVHAHATSTPAGDRSEALALKAVFTDVGAHPRVSSSKALTGHGLSLAGAMGAAVCTLALQESFIPGAAHLEEPDPVCDGLDLPRTSLDAAPRLVLNNSSGFGGSNVCHLLRRPA